MSDPIRVERRASVALITMDRPKALNALDRATLRALRSAIEGVGASDARALVLTGEGRAFVAGADIAEMQGMTPADGAAFSALGHETLAALEALEIPTLAAVNGYALGGGCELACACDWIYASDRARFGQPEVKLGVIPGFGGTSRLARRVGVAWAKEIVLSGEPIDAEEALRIGLANRVFAGEELLERALAAGEAVATGSRHAVALAKRVLQEGQDIEVRAAHAMEQYAFGLSFASEDRSEGMAAFVEKRDAKFSGC